MYTILSITIIIALLMLCCFLYAKNRELEAKIQVLKDSRDLARMKKEESDSRYIEYERRLERLGRVPPICYSIKRGVHGFDVMALLDAGEYICEAVIKSFYCSVEDNDDYIQRCAEELLDKLNEEP